MQLMVDLGKVPVWTRSRALGSAVRSILQATAMVNLTLLQINREAHRKSGGRIPLIPPLYRAGVRYQEEPQNWELEHFDCIPVVYGRKWGDCFPRGTLLLTDSFDLVPIELIEPGVRVWGYDKWVTVEAWAEKGTKTLDAVHLNNGSTMLLTPNHDVAVWDCPKHPSTWIWDTSRSDPCRCELSGIVKRKVSDITPSMVLAQPERLPFGHGDEDPDLSYLKGLYLSDGWGEDYRFAISGKDGHPKEAQKLAVQSICKKLGVDTRWHGRYIAVNDRPLAQLMGAMGHRAYDKHALTLNLREAQAQALLKGIMADSGSNTSGGRTFTTTSRVLATQARVLLRMFGHDTSYRYVPEHGGLGTHPVHRLGIREPQAKGGKLLRVKEISRSISEAPCYDIQTEDNRVYLPEHDVTVHQCDDLAPIRVAELVHSGEDRKANVMVKWKGLPNGQRLYHVIVRRSNVTRADNFRFFKDERGFYEDPCRVLGMGGAAARKHAGL